LFEIAFDRRHRDRKRLGNLGLALSGIDRSHDSLP